MALIANPAVDPMNSRLWFKLRTPLNFAVSIGICAALVMVLSLLMPVWVADLIAIGAVSYIFIVFLNKRPIRIRCEHCGKDVLSDTPWVCGFCQAKNEDADDYPFVHRCKHCSAVPKAYKCHHAGCGQLIFLTADRLELNYAYCLNLEVKVPAENKEAFRREQRQEKEHKIIMAELDAKLAAARKKSEYNRPKTLLEEKKDSLEKRYDGVMAARDVAKKKKAEIAETYKDDPAGREDAEKTVDDWLQDNTP